MQIVSREEMQTIDESVGLPGVVLMGNVGQTLFRGDRIAIVVVEERDIHGNVPCCGRCDS